MAFTRMLWKHKLTDLTVKARLFVSGLNGATLELTNPGGNQMSTEAYFNFVDPNSSHLRYSRFDPVSAVRSVSRNTPTEYALQFVGTFDKAGTEFFVYKNDTAFWTINYNYSAGESFTLELVVQLSQET